MSNITKVDKNLIVDTKIEKDDIVFYNVTDEPFKVYGIYHEDGKFRRLPESVAKQQVRAFGLCTPTLREDVCVSKQTARI